jgi:transketolase
MRNTFVETLCEIAAEDSRVWLVCGDLGFSVLEVFANKYPDRYLNAGVSEQNMTGIAAGLANCGKIVFTYSIANFPVMRCLEQIRNDVCYHNLNVRVVAVGGGLAYGTQGYTHHGVEDLAVTRVLPNMTVIAPADPVETRLATRALVNHAGPCYLRLGKANEPKVHSILPQFQIGRAIEVRAGSDLTLITTGGVLETALQAAGKLAAEKISARVLSMHTVQPLDTEAVLRAARETRCILTVEEHALGGLSAAVAEQLAISGEKYVFRPMHLRREPFTHAGSQASLRGEAGLSAEAIAQAALQSVQRKHS